MPRSEPDTGRPERRVSLLRAVNVGGRTVAMARIRSIYVGLGCTDVETYVQSGNVLYRRPSAADAVTAAAEAAILAETGLVVRAIDRSHADLERIVAGDPFPDEDPGRRVVVFLSGEPTSAAVAALEVSIVGPETVVIRGPDAYIRYPDGQGRSKLTLALIEKRLGVTGTARNWRTVDQLLERTAPST